MNKDNLTDLNEYKNNMPDSNMEELSDELINSYMNCIENDTPDLWSRIDAGFDEEINKLTYMNNTEVYDAKNVSNGIVQNKIADGSKVSVKKKVTWRRYAGLVAAILIIAIAIPVAITQKRSKKSEDVSFISKGDVAEECAEDESDAFCEDTEAYYSETNNIKADEYSTEADMPADEYIDQAGNMNAGETEMKVEEGKEESVDMAEGEADENSNDADTQKDVIQNTDSKYEFIGTGTLVWDGSGYYIKDFEALDEGTDIYDILEVDSDKGIYITNSEEITNILLNIKYTTERVNDSEQRIIIDDDIAYDLAEISRDESGRITATLYFIIE